MSYGVLPYGSLNPNVWNYQTPFGQSNPYQGLAAQQGQSGYGSSGFGGASPFSMMNPNIGQSDYPAQMGVGQIGMGMGQSPQHLSPEQFAGTLSRTAQAFTPQVSSVDAIFIAELARCGRGLQDVADQLEGRDPDTQRRGYYAATAHLFYAFGLLSSKGIFIPGDLPGKQRTEGAGPASSCREFGKELDRLVDKIGSGRGIIDEISILVERGKICYADITRGIEQTAAGEKGGESPEGMAARKKVA